MQTTRVEMTNISPSQYTNYDFNAMCVFKGVLIGSSSNGLSIINKGDTDRGTQIDGYFIPVSSALGTPANRKRINAVYMSGRFSGPMNITLIADDSTTGGPYPMNYRDDRKLQTRRIDTGRGLEFSYIKMKIANVGGGWFAIDAVEIDVNARRKARR